MNPRLIALAALLVVTACSFTRKDDASTIKSLMGRTVPIEQNAAVAGGRQKAIAGYRDFVNTAPDHEFRPEAMRRLGDLQLESAEDQQLAGTEAPAGESGGKPGARDAVSGKADYRHAINWYLDLLRAYPNYAGNDRVLYQLAKAYEQKGDLPR